MSYPPPYRRLPGAATIALVAALLMVGCTPAIPPEWIQTAAEMIQATRTAQQTAPDGPPTATPTTEAPTPTATTEPTPLPPPPDEPADIGGEPNDTADTATTIAPDILYTAQLADRADVDFYTVDVPVGAFITLIITPTATLDGVPSATLRDASGRSLISGRVGLDGFRQSRRLNAETGGLFTLEVRGATGDYQFRVAVIPAGDAGTGGDAADNINRPTPIETAADHEGDLGDLDRFDHYRFTVEQGGVFTITLTALAVEQPLQATIYDANQSHVNATARLTAAGQSETLRQVLPATAGGTFIVRVGGAGRYGLRVDTAAQNDGDSGDDAGASQVSGVTVAVNTAYSGLLGNRDSDDYFLFNVAGGAILNIQVAPVGDGQSDQVTATLYNAGGGFVADTGRLEPGASGTIARILNATEGGDYALRVRGAGAYTFTIQAGSQDDAGSGGDAGSASGQALAIEVNTAYTGLLGHNDRDDYYRFNVAGGAVLDIHVTTASDATATLYNAAGGHIAASGRLTPGDEGRIARTFNRDEGGDYILRVSGGGAYDFAIHATLQDDAGSGGDAANDAASATPVETGADHAGLLGDRDTDDYYGFSVAAGVVLTITAGLAEGSDGDVTATLYNAAGRFIADTGRLTGDTTRGGIARVLSDAEGGDYVLRVRGRGAYVFAIAVEPQQDGGSAGDAGSEAATARMVAPNQPLRGQMGDNDGADYYRLDDLAPGASITIEVSVEAAPANASVTLDLYSAGGRLERGAGRIGAGESLTVVHTYAAGGSLYLRLRGAGVYHFQILPDDADDESG